MPFYIEDCDSRERFVYWLFSVLSSDEIMKYDGDKKNDLCISIDKFCIEDGDLGM